MIYKAVRPYSIVYVTLDANPTIARFVAIAVAFGQGILVAIFATSSTYGGHINPVTFAMVITGRPTVVTGIFFTLAYSNPIQLFGAFVGALLVKLVMPTDVEVRTH